MHGLVQDSGVYDKTSLSLTTRIVRDSYSVVTRGYVWIFLLNNGTRLTFFRLGDSLFQHWYHNPLLQPMLWWLKVVGWSTDEVLSIHHLLEAIDRYRFGRQIQDCQQQGLQNPPTHLCQREVERLDQLTRAIERAQESFPPVW